MTYNMKDYTKFHVDIKNKLQTNLYLELLYNKDDNILDVFEFMVFEINLGIIKVDLKDYI